MDVTVFVFNGVMTRDVLSPVEAMGSHASIRYISPEGAAAYGFEPLHTFHANGAFVEVRGTDLLIVPGGLGSIAMMRDRRVATWIGATARSSRYVMSVSTGSLLLAAAGLLQDRDASGHWLAFDELEAEGAHASGEAITWHGRVITTSGSLAAAEVARTLPERLEFGPLTESV